MLCSQVPHLIPSERTLGSTPYTLPHSSEHVLCLALKTGIHPHPAGIKLLKAGLTSSMEARIHREYYVLMSVVWDIYPPFTPVL